MNFYKTGMAAVENTIFSLLSEMKMALFTFIRLRPSKVNALLKLVSRWDFGQKYENKCSMSVVQSPSSLLETFIYVSTHYFP